MARVPPHDLDSEKAVVGSMAIDESVVDIVAGIVAPEDFYSPACRAVYQAALVCKAKGRPIDFQTLQSCMGARKQLELVGGLPGLTELLDSVPTAANAAAYATTVKERAILRRLILACREVAEAAYDAGDDFEQFLADSQGKITTATDYSNERPWEHLGDLVDEQVERLRQPRSPSILTGFHELDGLTHGLYPGDLVIVAGRPSAGKTAFVNSIIKNTFSYEKRIVSLFCSLEMNKYAVTSRYVSMATGIPISAVKAQEIKPDDWVAVDEAKRYYREAPLVIADAPAMTLTAVRARARRLQAQHGISLIAVDYLQLMRATEGKDANRERQVASISAGLKEIAKEFNVPVIALSQLNRGVEGRDNKRPGMADLRESGAIEQDADIIMFVYRDEVYNPTPENKGQAEIIVAKQRDGMVGTVRLEFDGPRVTFRNPGETPEWSHPAPSNPQPDRRCDQIVGWFEELGVSEQFLLDRFGPRSGWDQKIDEIRASYRGFKSAEGGRNELG